jgi:hypothetical protein
VKIDDWITRQFSDPRRERERVADTPSPVGPVDGDQPTQPAAWNDDEVSS